MRRADLRFEEDVQEEEGEDSEANSKDVQKSRVPRPGSVPFTPAPWAPKHNRLSKPTIGEDEKEIFDDYDKGEGVAPSSAAGVEDQGLLAPKHAVFKTLNPVLEAGLKKIHSKKFSSKLKRHIYF